MTTQRIDSRIQKGMQAQLKLRQACLDRGERPLGWKVGFGAPAALERLQLEAPLIGFLTNRTLLPSAATAVINGWTKALAEPEIAVYMGADLAPDADRATAVAAIAAIGPAIELADLHFPPDDVETILARNIYHRHVILGEPDPSRAGCVLDGLVGHVVHNGVEIAATTDLQSLTGDPVAIVQHVANLLPAFGAQLRAGEFIITGSIVPPMPVAADDEIRYRLAPLDEISIRLAG